MASLILGSLVAGAVALTGTSPALGPQLDCVQIHSPSKLSAGSTLRRPIGRGLEFRLSKDWNISVGPVADRTLDYLWMVSPPLQNAPHRMFGKGYGLTAPESAKLNRSLHFVLNRTDYDAAKDAIALPDGAETLRRLDALGRGALILYFDSYELKGDDFKWISFHGEACVPR